MALVMALPRVLLNLGEDGPQQMRSEGKRFTGPRETSRPERPEPAHRPEQRSSEKSSCELRNKVLSSRSLHRGWGLAGTVWGISDPHQQPIGPKTQTKCERSRPCTAAASGRTAKVSTGTVSRAQRAPVAFSEPAFVLSLIITYPLPFSEEDFTENASRTEVTKCEHQGRAEPHGADDLLHRRLQASPPARQRVEHPTRHPSRGR